MADETKKRKRGKRGGKNKTEPESLGFVIDTKPELAEQKPAIKFEESKYEFDGPIVNEGETLDADSRQYFREIEKRMAEADEGEMVHLIENVLEEVQGKELDMMRDYDGSRILEKLLTSSTDQQIRLFMDRLRGGYHDLFLNPFASHVCQTLLKLSADGVVRELTGYSDLNAEEYPELGTLEKMVLVISEEVEMHWLVLITHRHASHVLRTLLNVLSGTSLIEEKANRSKRSKSYNSNHKTADIHFKEKSRVVPQSFSEKLFEIVKRIITHISDSQLKSLISDQVGNPVLQLLVAVPEVGDELISKLLKDFSVQEIQSLLITDIVGSHLMEKILQFASEKKIEKIYKNYFRGNIENFCLDNNANYVVQHLIGNTTKEKHYKEILEVLQPKFSDLLFGFPKRSGVVAKIVEGCIKFPKLQHGIMKSILVAFGIGSVEMHEHAVSILLNLTRAEKFAELIHKFNPQVQGSLLVQNILKFEVEHCKVVIDSIANLSQIDIKLWAVDKIASRILDTFLSSTTVPNKSKRIFVDKCYGLFAELACHGIGSHLVDYCWQSSNLITKEKIANELANKSAELKKNFFGKFVLRNCNIELFQRRRDDWIEHQKKSKATSKPANHKFENEIDELFAKAGKN